METRSILGSVTFGWFAGWLVGKFVGVGESEREIAEVGVLLLLLKLGKEKHTSEQAGRQASKRTNKQ